MSPRRPGARPASRALVAACLGGLVAAATTRSAAGQGAPAWAPTTDLVVDAGPAHTRAHIMPVYRRPDGGAGFEVVLEALEFALGFNPLEPAETFDEPPPAAASAPGADAGVPDAGVPNDGGAPSADPGDAGASTQDDAGATPLNGAGDPLPDDGTVSQADGGRGLAGDDAGAGALVPTAAPPS